MLVGRSESLQLAATNFLERGIEMVTNSHGSQVTIDGDNARLDHQPQHPEVPAPDKAGAGENRNVEAESLFFIILLQYFYN